MSPVSPNHLDLARHLGQGKARLNRLQVAAGVSQALVVLAERLMPSLSERFVMQLHPAGEVQCLSRSNLGQT